MRIDKIKILNFRLLRRVTLTLEDGVTVIVGRNNSGKTSLTELFRRLLGDKAPSFRLEDFSCASHEAFWEGYKLYRDRAEHDAIRAALPTIEIQMTVSYANETGVLGPLGHFIVDLDSACTDAIITIRYELDEGKLDAMFSDLTINHRRATKEGREGFFKSIKERVPKYFHPVLEASDPNDPTNKKQLDWNVLRTLVHGGFINAQRWLDDTTHRDNDVLGKVLEAIFESARSELADENDKKAAVSLDSAVENMQVQLDSSFNTNLNELLPALSLFGYPGLTDPQLRTETTLDVQRLLVNHTKVRYAGANGVNLPEAYNGLGPRNLIIILLRLLEFFKSYKTQKEVPGIQLIFIEEPEAHLHPQMAEVFIRKLNEVAKLFSDKYNGGVRWPVQFVVTTHSSHLANEARFETIRYFLATAESNGHHLRETRIKDLRKGFSNTETDDSEFLHQYMTLTRCDLFFADKAVLIEGCAERLLLPRMIAKIDEAGTSPNLSSQYISVVEICGAYAHRFFKLLEFLELRTLIVTDLDSAMKNPKNALEKCLVGNGTHTTNACIKAWFDKPDITPAELIAKTPVEKTHGQLHLAYEVPEKLNGPCGRTFEDAFILANTAIFDLSKIPDGQQAQMAWDKAAAESKSEFALRFAIEKHDWSVPRYIKNGLEWLSQFPADAGSVASPSSASPRRRRTSSKDKT